MGEISIVFGLLTLVTIGMILGLALWANDEDACVLCLGLIKPAVISWSPRITVFHYFLSSEEIEKRIAVFSQVPAKNGELIQVLRYEKDQFYRPRHDYFADTFNLKREGQRVATMLMCLSDDIEGGETYFRMDLDGSSDPKSLHGGCEVLLGEKWSATKWMRQKTSH